MAQRYWVVGGEYRDPGFKSLVPGTETMAGPFADEAKARNEWMRLTYSPGTIRRPPATPSPPRRRERSDRGRTLRPALSVGGRRAEEILTEEALAFLAALHRRFEARRQALLAARAERQRAFDAGALPDFLPETADIRAGDWTSAPFPADLMDRRVEITGPADRKMVINALNSGAPCFMADFEDATAPTWANLIEGQANLRDRWLRRLAFDDPASGKHYALGPTPAVLMVRPRGWHLDERHIGVDSEAMAGGLFDFGLYLFHNARSALDAGSGPYFYLPKLEGRREAALWSDVFAFAESRTRHRARHDQGDRADRDDHRRLRNGRDPPRASGKYRRPQLRPLGLYLLDDQAARAERRTAHARSFGDDDG